ncbi:MAG: hypothetical protein AMXMBFR47_09970 [Planctomycetota bacterium]
MAARVLIVDDAAFMRYMIRNILTKLGYEIAGEACNGEEACELYDRLTPDLMTLDLIMPRKTGLEALRDIRAKHPGARVIVMSAVDQRQPLMEALKLGAADYLVKPFEEDRVRDSLSRLGLN